MAISRRHLIGSAAGIAAAATISNALLDRAIVGGIPTSDAGRYGPLGPPDGGGLRLPEQFTGRVIGRSGDKVEGTSFNWHSAPDGAATFRRPGNGWVYASNSEVSDGGGGVSAISFTEAGEIDGAFSILSGTSRNCAGGPTPWGTWLSCEESGPTGQVWECNPLSGGQGVVRPQLGSFNHEAAAVDPQTGMAYLTEDRPTGRLYRFVPTTKGDLTNGQLFAAAFDTMVGGSARVSWIPTTASEPDRASQTSSFNGGEGAWIDERRLLFTTKGDKRVWALDLTTQRLSVLHDCLARPSEPLNAVDNIVVHRPTGDIYVAEDGGNMELCMIEEQRDEESRVSAFLQLIGQDSSEIAGPAFSPSGDRLYFSSQRGSDGRGITYEVIGPFASTRPESISAAAPTKGLQPATRNG